MSCKLWVTKFSEKHFSYSQLKTIYLCVDRNEENVCVKPDADDDDFPVEAGAQPVTQARADECNTPAKVQ